MVSTLKTNALLLAGLLLVPWIFGDFSAYQLSLFLIYGIAAQGIGFLWGRLGILPLGQTVFFGAMAYVSAIILKNTDGLLLQLALMVCALMVLSLLAFTLSTLIFRGRSDSGPYFSLITLALVMITEQLAGTASSITGGFNGLSGFSPIGGLDPFGDFYYLVVGVVVVVTTGVMLLDHLPAGLLARATGDNEQRLQLLGFPTHLVKGAGFALSALLAGIAGILYASHQEIVTPSSAGFLLSTELVIWTAVGGRFHPLGALLGAVFIGFLSSELRDIFQYWEVVIALVFILVVLKAPEGIFGFCTRAIIWLQPKPKVTDHTKIQAPESYLPADNPSLTFTDTHLSAGGVRILNGIGFECPNTGILCVIGPNGAGKTTLLNAITGNLPTISGQITLGARRVDNRAPHAALKSGIGRKLQIPSIFYGLTVSENLELSVYVGRAKIADYFSFKTRHWKTSYTENILANPAIPLKNQLDRPASELPQGHRQLLEFIMSTVSEPRILLLDEPCAGLSHAETKLMNTLIQEFQSRNKGLIIAIEHDMTLVEALADQVLVLHEGQVLATGSFEAVRQDEKVTAVYAGGHK
jgi:ABC-type uncharacterized transport system ATPase subunit/ABC-type branched-subunit amino acid transport system permease subunit